ncbi:AfsR/SARP family transcriptional regulator [Streptomyces massasporeus]|uniref:AfsR/SARP family transcriptional regulator n=1 Tax=Streptomyces massasporeus TaxID=67324 RepID=UPI0037B5BFC7
MDLGSPQQRAVLLALLMAGGRAVTVHELVDAVWGATPPNGAVSTIRTYVSRLRRVLEPDRPPSGTPQVMLSVTGGYALRVEKEAVDLAVFEDMVNEAKRARDAGNLPLAADRLHSALGTWQGSPLPGVPGPFADVERARLNEWHITALEMRLEVDIHLGHHDEVVAELAVLRETHPLREYLTALQMLALYRCGRQAEALAVYRGARDTLARELGVEPGPALQHLHGRLLSADPSLVTPRSGATAQEEATKETGHLLVGSEYGADERNADPERAENPPGLVTTPVRQLPADLTAFAGRSDELAYMRTLVPGADDPTVVITINGMAGVGKTALAVRLAHVVAGHFPEGQLYVNLRGFDPAGAAVDPSVALSGFLTALGVPPQQVPSALDAQSALFRSLVSNRRLLIVLDNARDSEHVRTLLPGSTGCMVMVTSRDHMVGLIATHNARPVALGLLTDEEAVQFLEQRVGASRLAAEPHAVARIVTACARLPLALAIVAARAATHPGFALSTIAAELGDTAGSLDAFASSDSTIDVRAVFSCSYLGLSPASAGLFRLLAFHPGPRITTAAVVSLTGTAPRDARRQLAELTNAQLLVESAPGVFALHDLLRDYARELADEHCTVGERAAALERLFHHYLLSAHSAVLWMSDDVAEPPTVPPVVGSSPIRFDDQVRAKEWLDAECTTLVTMVESAAVEDLASYCWQLARVITDYLQHNGHWGEQVTMHRIALAAAERSNNLLGAAQCHRNLGRACAQLGLHDEARDQLEQAMILFRRIDDHGGCARTEGSMAYLGMLRGDHAGALRHAENALSLYEALGDRRKMGRAANNLGWLQALQGRYQDALVQCNRAIGLLGQYGDSGAQASAWDSLGYIHHHMGDHDQAIDCYRRAVELARDIGDRANEADVLVHLGETHRAAGQMDAARAAWNRAIAVLEEMGGFGTTAVRERLDGLMP